MEAPCKDCTDRTYPKTCEKHCKKWIEYKIQHDKEKIAIRQQIQIKNMLGKHC